MDLVGRSGELELWKIQSIKKRSMTILMVQQMNFTAQLELLRQLINRHSGRVSLSLSSSLWIVPEISTTLAARADCRPKPLNILSTMVDLRPRKLILTLQKMAFANSQRRILLSKSSTQSISLW